MGLYDSIITEITCPITENISDAEIQIKWAGGNMERYYVGDDIDFAKNMKSIWIRQDYLCDHCETLMDKQYPLWRIVHANGVITYPALSKCPNGKPDVKEFSHQIYINIQKGKITEIIPEIEFKKRGLEDFLDVNDLMEE